MKSTNIGSLPVADWAGGAILQTEPLLMAMTKNYSFGNAWNRLSVELDIVEPSYTGMDAYKIANFKDFWYLGGSRFYTSLTCGAERILSQEFKDLYYSEGWTGLEFGEPIVIHGLKSGLVQPMPYYFVKWKEACEKVIAHSIVVNHVQTSFRTDWEVINSHNLTFFKAGKLGIRLCQEEVMNVVLKRKLTNILFDDFYSYFHQVTSYWPAEMMEF